MDKKIYILGFLWVIYLFLLLPWHLIREKSRTDILRYGVKMTLSGVFCLVGMAGVILYERTLSGGLILAGLLCAMAGDYYMVFAKVDMGALKKGILLFGMTQLSYIGFLVMQSGFHILESVVTVCIFAVAISIGKLLGIQTKKIRYPIVCYLTLVIFMTVKSVLVFEDSGQPLLGVFMVGALFFLVSDGILCLWMFRFSQKFLSFLVSVFYFSAQLLIATSLFL